MKKLNAKPYTPPESAEQISAVQWARQYCRLKGIDMLYAVPNQIPLHGHPNKWGVINWLKAMGLTKGVPDLVLASAHGHWHGLYLETKARGHTESSLSPEQKRWRERLTEEGYLHKTWERADEFRQIVEAYLRLPRTCVIHDARPLDEEKEMED